MRDLVLVFWVFGVVFREGATSDESLVLLLRLCPGISRAVLRHATAPRGYLAFVQPVVLRDLVPCRKRLLLLSEPTLQRFDRCLVLSICRRLIKSRRDFPIVTYPDEVNLIVRARWLTLKSSERG